MLNALNWVNIKHLAEINTLVFIHKYKVGQLPDYLSGSLKTFTEIHEYSTRYRSNFVLDRKNKKQTQNSVFFKTLMLYNNLSDEIKSAISNVRFKYSLKAYYRVQYYVQ